MLEGKNAESIFRRHESIFHRHKMSRNVFLVDKKVFFIDRKVFFVDKRNRPLLLSEYCRRAIKVFFVDRLPLLPISICNIYPKGDSIAVLPLLRRTRRKANFFYNGFTKGTFTIVLKIGSTGARAITNSQNRLQQGQIWPLGAHWRIIFTQGGCFPLAQ